MQNIDLQVDNVENGGYNQNATNKQLHKVRRFVGGYPTGKIERAH